LDQILRVQRPADEIALDGGMARRCSRNRAIAANLGQPSAKQTRGDRRPQLIFLSSLFVPSD
jgi:hypothetical protein